MEEIKIWFWVCWETIRPTGLSWFVVLPVVFFLLFIIAYRGRKPNALNAWHEVGRRVRRIGWVVIGTSVVLYLCSALVWLERKQYKHDYETRLMTRAQKTDQWDVKKQVGYLASSIVNQDQGVKELADMMKPFVIALKKDERVEFSRAFCDTRHDKEVMVIYEPLYLPPEKIDEHKKKTGAVPMELATGDKYTPEQCRMYDEKNIAKLNESLTSNQWERLVKQFINPLSGDTLIDLAKTLCDTLGDRIQTLRDKMYNAVLEEASLGQKLAWSFGCPDRQNVFDFLLKRYGWLNNSVWLLLYIIVGIVFVVRGTVMARGKLPQDLRV